MLSSKRLFGLALVVEFSILTLLVSLNTGDSHLLMLTGVGVVVGGVLSFVHGNVRMDSRLGKVLLPATSMLSVYGSIRFVLFVADQAGDIDYEGVLYACSGLFGATIEAAIAATRGN